MSLQKVDPKAMLELYASIVQNHIAAVNLANAEGRPVAVERLKAIAEPGPAILALCAALSESRSGS